MDDITESAFFCKHSVSPKSPSTKSRTSRSHNNDECSNTIVKKASLLLNVEEEEVKWAVENREIGEVFSIYQILSGK